MKVNAELVVKLRKERSWSPDELAIAAGLDLRTVQRVEKHGLASLQTKKALASALAIDARDLDTEKLGTSEEARMKSCPVCGSKEIYQYKDFFQSPGAGIGETLLPGLSSGFIIAAKIRPTVCADCGHVRVFASEEARRKLKTSKHWKLVRA